MIFVSHDIDEVLEITDRATVLRDGRVAGSFETRAMSKPTSFGLSSDSMSTLKRFGPLRRLFAAPSIVISELKGGISNRSPLPSLPAKWWA